MLREHEKFLAFIILVLAVLTILVVATAWPPEKAETFRVLDAGLGGLLLALGAAANALFRIGTIGDEQMKGAAAQVIQQAAPPQPVVIDQPADKPVPVNEASPAEDLPPMARL